MTRRRSSPKSTAARRAAVTPGVEPRPTEPAPAAGARPRRIAVTVIVAAWALLFSAQLFGGRVFVLGDARVFRPFAEFSRERWRQDHQRTYWNPYVLAGIGASASLADPRPQYLPDALLDVYERVRLPNACPLAGPLLAHLAGMLATAALVRALWGAGAAGMAWAALAWGLGPILLVPCVFGHDAQFVSSSLIPVVLLAVHGVFSAERPWGAALGLALAFAIQCLTGHPQVVVYSGMLVAAFAVERARRFRRTPRLAWLAGAAALAVAMSAAVWWPALLYSAHSLRGGQGTPGMSLGEVAKYSMGPGDLISIVWPDAVGFGGATYWGAMHANDYPRFVGVTVVLLALAAAWSRRGRDRGAPFWWWVIGIALAVSMGTQLGPLYGLLHAVVPLWSKFRVPSVILVAAHLGLALLSARALLPAPASGKAPAARSLGAPWVAAGIVVAALGLGLALGPLASPYAGLARAARPAMVAPDAARAAHAAGADLLLRAAFAAAALLLLRRASATRASWVPMALSALLAADLATVSVPFIVRGTGRPSQLDSPPPPALARLGAQQHTVRVSSARLEGAGTKAARAVEFYANDWITWRARSLGGTHGAVSDAWRVASNLTRSHAAMRALGVVYMSSNQGAPWDTALFQPVASGADEIVYRLRGALGRAYAVERVVAMDGHATLARGMMARDFPPERVALTTESAAAGDYPGSSACVLRWVSDEPDRLVLDTAAPGPAFVVVADSYDPGWRADIDGRAAHIVRANLLVRGLAVPAGRHRITMAYAPEGWGSAVVSTRVGFVVWLVLAAVAVAVARRPRPLTRAR